MAEVETPNVISLPQPQTEHERQVFLAIQEQDRKLIDTLKKIVSLLP